MKKIRLASLQSWLPLTAIIAAISIPLVYELPNALILVPAMMAAGIFLGLQIRLFTPPRQSAAHQLVAKHDEWLQEAQQVEIDNFYCVSMAQNTGDDISILELSYDYRTEQSSDENCGYVYDCAIAQRFVREAVYQ